MTAEAERRPIDLDAEQEVDFGRYLRAVAARWWLLVVGIVAGAIIGYLGTLGGGTSYKATAQVYLGQPLAPNSAIPVTAVPTSIGLVSNLVTAESTIKAVGAKVHLPAARLRGHITTKPIVGITGAKLGTPAPLVAITVSGRPPAKIAAAANGLADVVIHQLAPYQASKLKTLQDQLAYDTADLKAIGDRLDVARAQQGQILKDKSISPTDKLVALANLNSVITQALEQQNAREQDRFTVRLQLSLTQDVEQGRIVSAAAATKTAAPSRRTGIAIGAFIGLLLGILVAILWEPVSRTWSKASASQS